jgi:tetratricopeptide (TPR) repeat protein
VIKILIIFLMPIAGWSQTTIQLAKESVLAGNRSEAVLAIKNRLGETGVKAKEREELLKFLNQITHRFLKESAQKTFQNAESEFFRDIDLANSRLREALKAEPDNLTIIKLLGRGLLKSGACSELKNLIVTASEINPFDFEVTLLKTQELVCNREYQTIDWNALIANQKEHVVYYATLRAQAEIFEKRMAEAAAALDLAETSDPGFPETYFWRAEILREQGLNYLEPLEKYLNSCQKLESQKDRGYPLEPRACSQFASAKKTVESQKDRVK